MAVRGSRALLLVVPQLLLLSSGYAKDTTGRLTVGVDHPSFAVSPTFFGLMTEEINHSYDGGLYGELIQNRSFRDGRETPYHWSLVHDGGAEAKMSLEAVHPKLDANWTSLRLDVTAPGARAGVANDGYWGIPIKPNTRYRASFWAMASPGFGPVTLDVESAKGSQVLAHATVPNISETWKRYSVILSTGKLDPSEDNRFVISGGKLGTLWLAQVSLFPPTYKNRPNGNRIDLMEKLGELNPSFLRLPGGNYLEGDSIATRFDWKSTVGSPEDRPGHQGPWGYRSSDGLGLLEFLEWCEDLHMQPLLAVYAGYSLRGEHVAPGKDLEPYVQDALDEIEYATGSTDTKWGAVRARNGHPKPFPLTYVEIGNEDEFDRSRSYNDRFAQFYDAIKAKYPRLQLIATAGVLSRRPDVIDDHYYRPASVMAQDAGHYDQYDRKGPKIFVGEWASIQGSPTPTFRSALGDAAWLTGLERNSDLVVMESYAPLLVNVNRGAAQWPTNLIGYDALSSFGSPAFYVQSMFGRNTGDLELPAKLAFDFGPQAPPPPPHGSFGAGTFRTRAEFKDIEVTRDGKTEQIPLGEGWSPTVGTWSVVDGALQQSSGRQNTHDTAGEPSWTDYTLHVKARKLGGAEGFLVLFHCRDAENYWQLNVGGWGDSRTAIQRIQDGTDDEVGEASNATVETGRWYDVRVELKGTSIRCYLDGKLVCEATDTQRPPAAPLYAAASRVRSTGEVILKLVNFSQSAVPLDIDLSGARSVQSEAKGWILTGQPGDQNTIDQPLKVAPKPVAVSVAGSRFQYSVPALSVVVLRVRTANK
jgi:alpha-N-arabinofuranosidase